MQRTPKVVVVVENGQWRQIRVEGVDSMELVEWASARAN